MVLVADSGSTKCDWVILDSEKKVISRIETKGLNPILLEISQVYDILYHCTELSGLKNDFKTVIFYGAGCGNTSAKKLLLKIFTDFFTNAQVHIEEDLMAAVHGATTEPGVVCILGTGSNCCYYDGQNIHVHQASLGFMVMDEGSGNYFGKKLLNAYFYNKMPENLKIKFESIYDLSLETVLKNLYEVKNPSAYLARYTPFLIEHKSEPFFKEIINQGLNELFNNLISCYKNELKENPLHFVGSIAFYLQDEIFEEAKERGLRIRSFVKRPIDNIVGNIEAVIS